MPLEPMSEDLMQGLDADRLNRFPGYAPDAMNSLATNAKQDLYPGDFQRQQQTSAAGSGMPQDFLGLKPQQYAQAQMANNTATDAPAAGHPNPVLAPFVKAFGAGPLAAKLEALRNDPKAMELLGANPELQGLLGELPKEPLTPEVIGSHPVFTDKFNKDHLGALMQLYSKYSGK